MDTNTITGPLNGHLNGNSYPPQNLNTLTVTEPTLPGIPWKDSVIQFDPSWQPDPSDVLCTWQPPEIAHIIHEPIPLLERHDMMNIGGGKKAGKSKFVHHILRSVDTDDPYLTCGIFSTIDTNSLRIIVDTEQKPKKLRKLQRQYVDLLGLQTMPNMLWMSLEETKRPYRMAKLEDAISDMSKSYDISLLTIDHWGDFLPGRNFNDTEAVSDLEEFIIRIKRTYGVTIISSMHLTKAGDWTKGDLGSMIDEKTEQGLSIKKISELCHRSVVINTNAREKPIPAFTVVRESNGLRFEGLYDPNEEKKKKGKRTIYNPIGGSAPNLPQF